MKTTTFSNTTTVTEAVLSAYQTKAALSGQVVTSVSLSSKHSLDMAGHLLDTPEQPKTVLGIPIQWHAETTTLTIGDPVVSVECMTIQESLIVANPTAQASFTLTEDYIPMGNMEASFTEEVKSNE